MTCPIETRENAELLLDYCARKLDAETTRLLERHMQGCPACREFRAGQKLLWDALDAWEAMPVSGDFNRRLYRRIEEESRAGWRQRLMAWASWRPALPVAAAACLVLAGSFILRNPAVVPDVSPEAVVTEVEQVERTLDDLEMLRQLNLVARVEDSSRTM